MKKYKTQDQLPEKWRKDQKRSVKNNRDSERLKELGKQTNKQKMIFKKGVLL